MKITIEAKRGKHSVEIPEELEYIGSVFGGLIIPVLLSMGYQEASIRDKVGIDFDRCIIDYIKEVDE